MSAKFDDTEAWCGAAAGWNLEFQQIDRGALRATFDVLPTPGMVLQRVSLDRRFHQGGVSPEGMMTFGVPEKADSLQWYGQSVRRDGLVNFNRRCGFEGVSEPGFVGYTFSVPTQRVLKCAAAMNGADNLHDRVEDTDMFRADRRQLVRLRNISQMLFEQAANNPVNPAALAELEDDMICLMVSQVLSGDPDNYSETRAQRHFAVDRALDVIRATGGMTPLSEVCSAAATSERSLRRGFRERFGLSPKQYIVATRLAGARASLLRAAEHETVAGIACDWGFWHLGRFSGDYRQMFGELPSDTFGRTRQIS